MLREWLDTIGTLVGAAATIVGVVVIPIFIFNASNKINDGQLDAQLEAEDQRSKHSTLQRYLDQMGTLLIENDLRTADDPEVRTLARARTATVIQRLDANTNRNVIRFLNEAGLTGNAQSSISLLAGADLRGAHLQGIDLSTMDLSGAILSRASLRNATLSDANLSHASMSHANLSGANLSGANLSGAILRHATLSDATLYQADLNGADLSYATLSGNLELASLNGADLYSADLSSADLDGADLRDSALSGADLSHASLMSSILVDANLSGANLSSANMSGAELNRAHLQGIFEDTFSDTSSGWTTAKGNEIEPYVVGYHAGRFRMYNPPPGNVLRATNLTAVRAIEDASIEADATLTRSVPQNRDYGWGIICRADVEIKNLYQLGIYADGSPTIWKVEDGNLKQLDTGNPIDAVDGGTATNHLRADCSGSTLALYVNDRKVLEATADSEFKAGLTGFYVSDSHNGEGVDILFDNFVVRGPQPKGLQ